MRMGSPIFKTPLQCSQIEFSGIFMSTPWVAKNPFDFISLDQLAILEFFWNTRTCTVFTDLDVFLFFGFLGGDALLDTNRVEIHVVAVTPLACGSATEKKD